MEFSAEFPPPSARPEAEVLIFDGNCAFCQGKVRTLERLLGDRIAYLSLHDPLVAERYPDLTFDRLMSEMVLIDNRERRLGGAAAVRYLAWKRPLMWPVALLMHLPFTLPLWQRMYQWVAVRRYKLSAKQAALDATRQSAEDEPLSETNTSETARTSETAKDSQPICEDACSFHLNK